MQHPNPYLQNIQSFIHRQFILDTMPPPSEPAFRQSRECLVEPFKKSFPFPIRLGFIGSVGSLSIQSQIEFIRANSEHGVFILHAIEDESKTPALDRAKYEASLSGAELIVNSALTTIAEDSAKEKYHRQNRIEKRRRKR